MNKLLIKLTPLEAYFLGGDRIFEIGAGNKHYYIRSLNTPSQSTLFGALRYIGIKNPSKGFVLDNTDIQNVGPASFELNNDSIANFGMIDNISPLYLYSQDNDCLLPTPLDHKAGGNIYSPFTRGTFPIKTTNGEKYLPADYSAKSESADSWLSVKSGEIYEGQTLFTGIVRVGIDKKGKNKAFFRKEYKSLNKDYSFAFIATVKDGFLPHNDIVYLGQGKSPFRAEWSLIDDEPLPFNSFPLRGMVYAKSDLYYKNALSDLYKECKFVAVKTRDYRVFTTNYDNKTVSNRFKKSNNIQLIRAGSVFWPNDIESFKSKITNQHAAIAGFNQIIIGGETQ